MGFYKLGNAAGFDARRDLQVIPVGQISTFYLPNFGEEVRVRSADPDVLTLVSEGSWENAPTGAPAPMKWFGAKKIVVRAKTVGKTQLLTEEPDGKEWDTPTTVVVVGSHEWRLTDGKNATQEFRQELAQLDIRQAAIRVAEDQKNSTIGQTGAGDGMYGIKAGMNWCGAFIYWCYSTAATLKGVSNPLGPNNDVVLSPQKAISWAIQNPQLATVLRYKGPSMIAWGNKQKDAMKQDQFIDAGSPGHELQPGDICLLRDDVNWRHVDMIYDIGDGDMFVTIDGNQGLPSMKIVQRSMGEKVGGSVWPGAYKHVFVHLNV